MEELCLTIIYKLSKDNVVADGLSCLLLVPLEEQGYPALTHDLLQEVMLYYLEAIAVFPWSLLM